MFLQRPIRRRHLLIQIVLCALLIWSLLRNVTHSCTDEDYDSDEYVGRPRDPMALDGLPSFALIKEYLIDFPVVELAWGELGRRTQLLGRYLALADEVGGNLGWHLRQEVDEVVVATFGVLGSGVEHGKPKQWSTKELRKRWRGEGRGVVIFTGKETFREIVHLVTALKDVLVTKLPIQIVYAGNENLPEEYRYVLTRMDKHISTLDLQEVIDAKFLQSYQNHQSHRPLAALFSKFEEVLLVDPATIFLHDPAIYFEYEGYKSTGSYFFHDQPQAAADLDPETQAFLTSQFSHRKPTQSYQDLTTSPITSDNTTTTSSTLPFHPLSHSPNVILLNKTTPQTLTSLLLHTHLTTALDNTTLTTLPISTLWWLSPELSSTPYTFNKHSACKIGPVKNMDTPEQKICSSWSGHRDANSENGILWVRGRLFDIDGAGSGKDKVESMSESESVAGGFREVPRFWMGEGRWIDEVGMEGCMVGGELGLLEAVEVVVWQGCVAAARRADDKYSHLYLG